MLGTSPLSSLAISDEITPISLQGNAATMVKANAGATVSFAATARAKIMVAARAAMSPKSVLAAIAKIMTEARASPTYPAILSAIVKIMTEARVSFLGATSLAGRANIMTAARVVFAGVPLALQALAKMMVTARVAPTFPAVMSGLAKIAAQARAGLSGSTSLAAKSSIQAKASAAFNFPVALAGMIKAMVSARVPLAILQTFSAGIIAVNAGLGNLFTSIFGLGTAYVDTPVMVIQGANLLFSVGADLTRYNYFRLDLTRPDGSAYSVATPDVYMGMVDAFTAIGNFEIGSYVVYRFLPGTLSSGRWAAQLYARDRTDASFYLSPIATFMI